MAVYISFLRETSPSYFGVIVYTQLSSSYIGEIVYTQLSFVILVW